ncbi:hypothetical protein MASR1M65_28560 [Saprospiraceae bacterium]
MLTIFSPHSFAQSKRKIACQLAHDLKQGTLIVVLKTDAKKLAYLEKFSKQGSDREMARYAKMLRRTLAERDTTGNIPHWVSVHYTSFQPPPS